VWEYRELLYFLLWREVKGRYRQMAFGPLWIIIAPLIQMVIFTFVFGTLAKLPSDGVPYPIFTYVALLPWQFFANAARNSAGSLLSQQNVIAKVYFPRLVIPLSTVLSAVVDFLASFVVLAGMMVVYRVTLTWAVLTLPLFLLLAGAIALAVGLWLAGLAVKYHDVANARPSTPHTRWRRSRSCSYGYDPACRRAKHCAVFGGRTTAAATPNRLSVRFPDQGHGHRLERY
jgi:lipopolysaccharide transport system permease protein